MKTPLSQREEILNELKHIVLSSLRNVEADVYLFGSWARGEEKRTSDIDVGIQASGQISEIQWIELLERIEESILPYHVDVVDLSKAEQGLVQKAKKEGILWSGYRNESSRHTKH